ncbi:MAG: DNA-deoxyinosine glycosylase [Clostridiales bacterium]|jgi:hypoxanthine-DNA glycosylase|nr:DNA-deoxyinosine glycosylase [Clostridiales bacterium]
MDTVIHSIAPVFDRRSKIIILGSMPSPKSREIGFYYGHPRNMFWPVMERVFNEKIPPSTEGKTAFLLERRVALWDALKSCDINGAADSSVKNPVANDIAWLLTENGHNISAAFTTGLVATRLYNRLCLPQTNLAATRLPSTSPANAARNTLETLAEAYSVILTFL